MFLSKVWTGLSSLLQRFLPPKLQESQLGLEAEAAHLRGERSMCGFCHQAANAGPVLCTRVSGVDTSVPKVPGDGCARGWHGGVRERTRRAELC